MNFLWVSLIDEEKKSYYSTRPSSPQLQNKNGWSCTVANRLTRFWCEWISLIVAFLLMSYTYMSRSAAALTTRESLLPGKNLTLKMLPLCLVSTVFRSLLLNGSHIINFKSSEPLASKVPESFHSRQFTHPSWPFLSFQNEKLVRFLSSKWAKLLEAQFPG